MSDPNNQPRTAAEASRPRDRFVWPPVDDNIREALEAVYRDGDWGRYHGRRTEELRNALSAMHGVEHVQLTCSGTMAVELALRGVGVGEGDEVLLAGYDFPGNYRAIEATGARPVLVDIEPDSWTIDVGSVESGVGSGTVERVKAIVVSHLHGTLAPMARIRELAERHGWAVVEDACQCPGAVVDGRPAGAWGDAGVLSFGGSKLLTAGRGGALLTADAAIGQRARVFSDRGGEALPLSELQAAVLLPQLQSLKNRNQTRSENAARLRAGTSKNGAFALPRPARSGDVPAYYKFAWRMTSSEPERKREQLCAALDAAQIPVGPGFRGFLSRSRRRCGRLTELTNAEDASRSTVVLDHSALLGTANDIGEIAGAIAAASRACLADGKSRRGGDPPQR